VKKGKSLSIAKMTGKDHFQITTDATEDPQHLHATRERTLLPAAAAS